MTSGGAEKIKLQRIAFPGTGHLVVFPVSGCPIPEPEASRLREFWGTFAARARQSQKLSSEVFIQLTQFGGGKQIIMRHAVEFNPVLGLGVWPDRPPPRLWSGEDFSNLGTNEKPPSLMYQILRVTANSPVRENARSLMVHTGAVIEMMISEGGQSFLESTRGLLLPSITSASLRHFPLYIPLLEGKSFGDDASRASLSAVSVYMRESPEDQGTLIYSKEPLDPILSELPDLQIA